MMGVTPETAVHAMEDAGAHVVGSNCGNGIDNMVGHRPTYASRGPTVFLLIHSNAGIPAMQGGQIVYPESPEYMAERFKDLAGLGVNIIGGCCGYRAGAHSRPGSRRWDDRGTLWHQTTGASATGKLRPVEVIERYGQCLELVPIDRRFSRH